MNEERLYCIRGAVCSENTADSITEQVGALCRTLFEQNDISVDRVVSIQFTVTPDLDALNPATALRRADTGFETSAISLFCAQEPVVQGMLPRVVRVMVQCYGKSGMEVRPAYLNGAEALRPDIAARNKRR